MSLQEKIKALPLPEEAAHVHSNGDFCWSRKPTHVWWPESLYGIDDMRALLDAAASLAAEHEAMVVEALGRMLPIMDRALSGLVFTADVAGQVHADMNTLRAALRAHKEQSK